MGEDPWMRPLTLRHLRFAAETPPSRMSATGSRVSVPRLGIAQSPKRIRAALTGEPLVRGRVRVQAVRSRSRRDHSQALAWAGITARRTPENLWILFVLP